MMSRVIGSISRSGISAIRSSLVSVAISPFLCLRRDQDVVVGVDRRAVAGQDDGGGVELGHDRRPRYLGSGLEPGAVVDLGAHLLAGEDHVVLVDDRA